ncbi:MAG: AsmA family protein [Rhodomicrobium sp.]
MGRILATLATILILLLGAAFAVPALVDWNSYRSAIEKEASAVLGRKVSILGDIDIVLLPEPHLRASDVAAGNGKNDGVLMTAAAVDVSLSLDALFGGRLDAGKLRLVHPVLTLDFSRPMAEPAAAAEAGALPFTAGVRNVEIEGGRISVFSRSGGAAEALALSGIDGTAFAARSNAFRFNGHISKDGRQYEVKVSASPHEAGLKVTGSAVDLASKASLQADGVLNASEDPDFEGSLAASVPQGAAGPNRLPFELQAKAAAKIGLADASLGDLELTLDPQNRAQVLTGSANLNFSSKTASAALKALSLDAGALLNNGSAWPGIAGSAPSDWSALAAAGDHLVWLYQDYALNLDLEAGLVQVEGEPVEGVKLHGSRTAKRWLFDEALATLPGDTAVKLAGTLIKPAQASQLSASVSLKGKNLGRLARWLVPSAASGGRVALGAFDVKGALTLSPDVSAFEGVTGSLDGTPFTARLHFDKAPVRRLQASLSGDNFDLSAFDNTGEDASTLSPDSLKSAWQAGLAQMAAMLGGGPEGFDTADIDISAGGIKIGAVEAKNVAVHVKFDRDLITVSKLSAETSSGLVLRAEGSVPLRGSGQGRFGGRLEARSPEAVVQIASLAGYDRGSFERHARDIAPAVLSVSYNAETAGTATAQIDGSLGPARVDGQAEFKGALSDWKAGGISAQLKLTEPDGNKLIWLLFPEAMLPPGASPSPGVLSIGLNGVSGQLQASASISTGGLQGQLDGSTDLKVSSFKGKASASTNIPEQFLPASLLALLGGEPQASLRVSANVNVSPGSLEARELSAESPGNAVTGQLALETRGGITQVDANLNAEKASLPSLFAYFLAATPADAFALAVPATLGAPPPPPDIWSGRPFRLSAFHDTGGVILLTAKTMKLSDTLALSDAQLHASLDKGRFEFEELRGAMLGGSLDASLSLTAKDSGVAGEAELSLSGADLNALASPGTAPAVTGQASLSLAVSGQGLSPRGLVSVLRGRGTIGLADGELTKLSPSAVQARAEELLAQQLPLTEDGVTKKVLEAVQADNFPFRRLKIPVNVSDGILEIRRASFRGEDATVRMEAYADLNKAQVDSTWQMGVSSDRHQKWPPVKVMVSGPLRELGARPRTLAAEDFVRTILVRKMEGDISRLEGLNKPPAALAKPPSPWTATQEAATPKKHRHKRDKDKPEDAPTAKTSEPASGPSFEQRMRDALDNTPNAPAAR